MRTAERIPAPLQGGFSRPMEAAPVAMVVGSLGPIGLHLNVQPEKQPRGGHAIARIRSAARLSQRAQC